MPTIDEIYAAEPRPARLFWTRRTSLTARILAVNIIALGLMAGSLFYIDSYRKQLLAERFNLARTEAEITADALAETPRAGRRALMARIGQEQHLRLRLYDARGVLRLDSFAIAPPSFTFIDPASEPLLIKAARVIDRAMNFILGSPPIPPYHDPVKDQASAWPEVLRAERTGEASVVHRAAPDETPVINAAAPVGAEGEVLLATRNGKDITQHVRDARQTLAIVIGITLLISIQLSLFLARTIVQPLRALVRAAVRVRLGRDRKVEVPRLPERRDEIGLLARALSDMTAALRDRIDAVERFAADVAHEIKNPLASLRSALEALDKVDDPDLRRRLGEIAGHDVLRIDRLVTEIAEASRIDAELSRTQFVAIDMVQLAHALVGARQARAANAGCDVSVTSDGPGPFVVAGDATRLERVLENLLDNAVSFSPPGGTIAIAIERRFDQVIMTLTDDGPGIPEESREKVFERFHSLRPASEDFGSHSGLGLAIARTIVEAHDGTLTTEGRADGRRGAVMVLALPAWEV